MASTSKRHHALYLGRIDARGFRLNCWGGRALGRGRRCRAGRRGRQGRRRWRWAAEGHWWRQRQRTRLFPERRGHQLPIVAWAPCKLSHVVVVLIICQRAESIKSLHGLPQATAARQQHFSGLQNQPVRQTLNSLLLLPLEHIRTSLGKLVQIDERCDQQNVFQCVQVHLVEGPVQVDPEAAGMTGHQALVAERAACWAAQGMLCEGQSAFDVELQPAQVLH